MITTSQESGVRDMDNQELIRLGMFTQELRRLQKEFGFWLQGAEVFSLTQADPLATIGAGGGDYFIQLHEDVKEDETLL